MSTTDALKLKQKILGLLIRNARERAGLNLPETAALLKIPAQTLNAYELGQQEPGLPTLEALARICNIPVSYFWADDPIPAPNRQFAAQKAIELRRKMLGIQLAQARTEAKKTQADVAERLGCSVNQVAGYEAGIEEIPFSQLNLLIDYLKLDLSYFLNGETSAPVEPVKAQPAVASPAPVATPAPSAVSVGGEVSIAELEHLPPDVGAFLQDPANVLYVKLAMRLQSLSAETLRTLAEGILDITY